MLLKLSLSLLKLLFVFYWCCYYMLSMWPQLHPGACFGCCVHMHTLNHFLWTCFFLLLFLPLNLHFAALSTTEVLLRTQLSWAAHHGSANKKCGIISIPCSWKSNSCIYIHMYMYMCTCVYMYLYYMQLDTVMEMKICRQESYNTLYVLYISACKGVIYERGINIIFKKGIKIILLYYICAYLFIFFPLLLLLVFNFFLNYVNAFMFHNIVIKSDIKSAAVVYIL